MSRLLIPALGLLVLAAASSEAAPFTGTFLIQAPEFPAISIAGSGSGDPTLPSISADSFVGSGSSPVTGIPPFTQVFLSVAGNEGGAVGTGPAFQSGGFGLYQLRGFGFGIPLVVVTGGSRVGFDTTARFDGSAGTSVSIRFDPWGTGVATISRTNVTLTGGPPTTPTFTVMCDGGIACPTAMLGGATANSLFFGGAAQIVLVAPINFYTTTGGIGGIPTFAVISLNYVPEPGSLLLLGSGGAVLGLAGWRRRSG